MPKGSGAAGNVERWHRQRLRRRRRCRRRSVLKYGGGRSLVTYSNSHSN